jgi:hypothetical protein
MFLLVLFLREEKNNGIQNSSKKETTPIITNPCQPLATDKDKDNDNDSSSSFNISLFESQLKKELISRYGQQDFDYAVREAVKHNKNNLAYIEGICKKRKEKIAVNKSLEEAKQKKREQYKDLTPEERKSWSNLHLFQLACINNDNKTSNGNNHHAFSV